MRNADSTNDSLTQWLEMIPEPESSLGSLGRVQPRRLRSLTIKQEALSWTEVHDGGRAADPVVGGRAGRASSDEDGIARSVVSVDGVDARW